MIPPHCTGWYRKKGFSFPFTINEDGEIYVSAPLDREEKDMVNRNAWETNWKRNSQYQSVNYIRASTYFTPYYLLYKTECYILKLTCVCVCVCVFSTTLVVFAEDEQGVELEEPMEIHVQGGGCEW